MAIRGLSAVRFILLFSFLALLFATVGSHTAGAQTVENAVIDYIISNTITNTTVAQYMISSNYLISYLDNNPQIVGYFLNTSTGVNVTFYYYAMGSVSLNDTNLVNFMSSASFGAVIQNPYQFINFIVNYTPENIRDSDLLLGSLTSNPSLATLIYYPNEFSGTLLDSSLEPIESNPSIFGNFLNNTALPSLVANNTQLIQFMSSPSSLIITGNPAALGSFVSNPALPCILGSNSIYEFLSDPQAPALLSDPNFINYLKDPTFCPFLENNTWGSSSSPQVSSFLSNPALSTITGNAIMLASVLSNPSLNGIVTQQGSLSAMISNPSLASLVNNALEFSELLQNPTLPGILSDTSGLVDFMGNPDLETITISPALLTTLFSNTELSCVLANQAGLATVLINPTIDSIMTNVYTFFDLLSNPALCEIAENPTAFISVMTTSPAMTAEMETSSTFVNFIDNPSFSVILANPSEFNAFLANAGAAAVVNNQYYLSIILANPDLGMVIGTPSLIASLFGNSQLAIILNNQQITAALLGNPSLSSLLNNQSQLSGFVSDTTDYNSIITNNTILASLISNPSLPYILNNEGEFNVFLTNGAFNTITQNPVLLGSILSNPAMSTILSNPTSILSLMINPALGSIFANPAAFSSFIGNPSLNTFLTNPTAVSNLGGFLNNPSNFNFLGSVSFTSFISNPSLAGIASNPSNLGSLSMMLGNPSSLTNLNNPQFGNLLGSSQLTNLLNNPGAAGIFSNPQSPGFLGSLGGLLNGQSSTGFGSLLGNPSLTNIISNPSVVSELGNGGGSFTNALSEPGASEVLGNSQASQLFSNGGLTNGLGKVTSVPSTSSQQGVGKPGSVPCTVENPDEGLCLFANVTYDKTDYTGVAGNGQIELLNTGGLPTQREPDTNATNYTDVEKSLQPMQIPAALPGQQSVVPLIQSVLQDNNQNGQWLITCPVEPDPQNSSLYFTTDSNSYIGGNRCLANTAPLITIISLYTSVAWTQFSPAFAYTNFAVTNLANGWEHDIADSGETYTPLPTGSSANSPTSPNAPTTTSTSTTSTALAAGVCPNQNFINNAQTLTFSQVVACASNAGFSGTQLYIIVSIAYAESSFNPAATGSGTGGCTSYGAMGLLQLGGCHNPGEEYTLSDYSPSTCSTWGGTTDWSGIYYNPTCAFQWAYAFVTKSPPITQSGCTQTSPTGGVPYCFWGTYWVNGAYCNYAPNTYSGYNCALGLNEACFPWGTPTNTPCTPVRGGSGSGTAFNGGSGGQASASGLSISSGYDTESYIFDQVPTSSQHGLWAWSAKYANLQLTNLSKLSVGESWQGLNFEIPDVCDYVYDYSMQASIQDINNTNITVPQFNRSGGESQNYINFSNYLFSPTKNNGGSGSCYTNLLNGIDCGGWAKISENGTVDVSGDIYHGVNIYYYGSQSASTDPPSLFSSSILAASPEGYAIANAVALNYSKERIVPYINYQLTIPSTYVPTGGTTTFYNQTFGVYNTHNYLNPSNFLDAFTFYGGDDFFASYNGFLTAFPINVVSVLDASPNSLSIHEGNFLSVFNINQAKMAGFGQSNPVTLGQYVYGQVVGPSYIAVSPNGYVFVINYSRSCGTVCTVSGGSIGATTKSDLFIFKFIPQGYLNFSKYQPADEPFTSTLSSWNGEWEGYYANTLFMASQNLYLMQEYELSQSTYTGIGSLENYLSGGGVLNNFIPLAVQADYNGDLFMVGASPSGCAGGGLCIGNGGSSLIGGTSFKLAGLLPPGSNNWILNSQVNQPAGFSPSSEFAVSPGGQIVYAANESFPGWIPTYTTEPSTGGKAYGGLTTNVFAYGGEIPLSYSVNGYSMNILLYMANGGPFNDSVIKTAFNSVVAQSPTSVFDVPANHHPISITDSKGILYVVDNWTFNINGEPSAIMMLRAFAQNGTEIPIDPTLIDTEVPNIALSGNAPPIINNFVPTYGWQPYGWPLSANITLPGGSTVSYCVADCTFDTSNVNTAYPPIGPRIDPTGRVGQNPSNTCGTVRALFYLCDQTPGGSGAVSIEITADFNDTLYIIAHPWNLNTGSLSSAKPLYTELLTIQPKIQNYTKLSFLDNASFICYLNVTLPANSPCISNSNTQILQYIYPPILGVPDSFGYVENLGSPEQYLNIENQLSALFPTGVNSASYQTQEQNELKNGISGQPNYQQLITQPTQGGSTTAKSFPTSFFKTDLNGYVVTPYNVTILLNQTWTFFPGVPINPEVPVCPPVVLPKINSKNTYYKYAITPLSDQGALNVTLEGGDPYLKYLETQLNYVQNLSDAGAITSPYINYVMFTNRLMGEVYINQTISPATAQQQATARTGFPLVVNASTLFNYQAQQYQQISSFGTAVAYNTQLATPVFSIGQQCGGGSGLATAIGGSCYYENNFFQDWDSFSYNNVNITKLFALFEDYKQVSHLSNIVLNLTKANTALGYNRFIYTYIDRFNNTVYMPLDVDVANIVFLSMNSNTFINPSNENETTVNVSGTAFYVTPTGTHPIPSGSDIYLYWDDNINYYNSTSSPMTNQMAYYKYAVLCALSPMSKSCQVANPLNTKYQQQPVGMQEAQNPSFNENGGGTCPMQPNSLIQPITYNCNIFGYNGLPAIQNDPNNPSAYQYCIPVFFNGTGLFSSQLGLIKIVQTDGNGAFKYSFKACGVGQNRVIGQYYGSPAPEPLDVSQTWLGGSGGDGEFAENLHPEDIINSPEFNYTYSPNMTATTFEIGSYVLSFGEIGIIGLLATMAVIAAIIITRLNHKDKKVKK